MSDADVSRIKNSPPLIARSRVADVAINEIDLLSIDNDAHGKASFFNEDSIESKNSNLILQCLISHASNNEELLQEFIDSGHALSATDTGGDKSILLLASAKLVQDGQR